MINLTTIVSFLLLAASGYAQQTITVFEPTLFKDVPNARDLSIPTDGNEVYFTAQSIKQDFSAIMVSKNKNGKWQKSQVASFSGQYKDLEPFISLNGLIMYFASNRPVEGREKEKSNYDIWKVERINLDSEWSTPINLGSPINSEADEFYPSVTSNGNMYFTAARKNGLGKEDIFVSEYKAGEYLSPTPLSESINSAGYEFNAFVPFDESYLIFTGFRREGGLGRGDLYISKKDAQGKWLLAEHLAINSSGIDYCPFVKDGVLYFTSDRSDLKPKYDEQMSTRDFLNELNKTENGKSRIYKVAMSALKLNE
jgi:WD40 repeat protein